MKLFISFLFVNILLSSTSCSKSDNIEEPSAPDPVDPIPVVINDPVTPISDIDALDLVQKECIKYFWDFGHPVSGLARERNTSGDVTTSGGTGFGIMTIPVAIERGFISRKEGLERMLKMTDFLINKAKKLFLQGPVESINTGSLI